MDISVESTINTALLMQQTQVDQDKQTSLLKKALDAQSSVALQLLQSVAPTPQLASEGPLGTRINTFA